MSGQAEVAVSTPGAEETLDRLLNQSMPIASLSGGGGIYALEDERGIVRYIGETGSPFHQRIYGRHCGGDDNSHKFSTVFNAGRLWQMSSVDANPIKRAICDPADGRISKELRRLFARSCCRARIVDLPFLQTSARKALETEILAIAPAQNTLWNDSRALAAYEPEDALDEFLIARAWPATRLASIQRQKARWDSLSVSERAVILASRR
jgi:hypothetical protein